MRQSLKLACSAFYARELGSKIALNRMAIGKDESSLTAATATFDATVKSGGAFKEEIRRLKSSELGLVGSIHGTIPRACRARSGSKVETARS
jgi:hypothetical protein